MTLTAFKILIAKLPGFRQLHLHRVAARRGLALATECAPELAELEQRFGPAAAKAALDALMAAERYRTWDAWSFAPQGIVDCLAYLMANPRAHVVEFGAGYSSAALASFCNLMRLEATIDSFEHQSSFNAALAPHLANYKRLSLHYVPLMQMQQTDVDALHQSATGWDFFHTHIQPVPLDLVHETRLPNAFYQLTAQSDSLRSINLLILDGPNGSGRSIAFPILKDRLVPGALLVMDDYNDYPFLEAAEQNFDVTILKRHHKGRKRHIILTLNRPR